MITLRKYRWLLLAVALAFIVGTLVVERFGAVDSRTAEYVVLYRMGPLNIWEYREGTPTSRWLKDQGLADADPGSLLIEWSGSLTGQYLRTLEPSPQYIGAGRRASLNLLAEAILYDERLSIDDRLTFARRIMDLLSRDSLVPKEVNEMWHEAEALRSGPQSDCGER